MRVAERPVEGSRGPAAKGGGTFLNPAMSGSRTRSVLLLQHAIESGMLGDGAIYALDGLAATGVRARRWINELPQESADRLDIVMGESNQPRPPRESGLPFEALLWDHGIFHFIVLASFFRFAYLEASVSLWLVLASLSTGLCAAASAIVTAHELGHKKPKSPGWRLARMLLFSIHYPHFTTEHNHNHHKWVATDNDPASATELSLIHI
mgnify:CR=1 FL=1